MQVYLEDDLSNFKTRFLQLLCGYLEIEERNIGKIIFANAKTKESLSFPGIPFYIPNPMNSSEKSIHHGKEKRQSFCLNREDHHKAVLQAYLAHCAGYHTVCPQRGIHSRTGQL